MSSLYSLGSIASLPFVPAVSDRLGRRMAILVGSIIMIIGAILQMAAQDCEIFHHRLLLCYSRCSLVAMFVIALVFWYGSRMVASQEASTFHFFIGLMVRIAVLSCLLCALMV